MTDEPYAVGIVEAAKLLSLSRSSIYNLIAQNRLRAVRVGSRRLIPLASVKALLAEAEA